MYFLCISECAQILVKPNSEEDNDSGTGSVECIPLVVMK